MRIRLARAARSVDISYRANSAVCTQPADRLLLRLAGAVVDPSTFAGRCIPAPQVHTRSVAAYDEIEIRVAGTAASNTFAITSLTISY